MTDVIETQLSFDDMALSEWAQHAFDAWVKDNADLEPGEKFALGRVSKLDRGYPLIITQQGAIRAEHAIAFVKRADERAVIGDWVVVRLTPGHDKGRIEEIISRSTELTRFDRRGHAGKQVLAANIDVALIAVALTKKPVETRGLIAALVIAHDAGVKPVVVLTKSDMKRSEDDLAADKTLVSKLAGEHVPVLVTSSVDLTGLQAIDELIDKHTTAIIMGPSGAGKSTLTNAMVGKEILPTGEVRERDGAGRHTTVAREMVSLPSGGLIIDTPGMRSMSLMDHIDGVEKAFPEIVDFAAGCRFRDCKHTNEPGCEVQKAVAAGELEPVRLKAYQDVQKEISQAVNATDPALLSRKRKKG